MNKITYLTFSLIFLMFLNGCAEYKPIFDSTNLQFNIKNYLIEGDKVSGKKIYTKLVNISETHKKNPNAKDIDLLINISKDKNSTSKDSSGKILEYRITLNTYIKVKDFLTEKQILNQTFSHSLTYKIQDRYYETVKLEKKSVESLIEITFRDLLIKLTQNIVAR